MGFMKLKIAMIISILILGVYPIDKAVAGESNVTISQVSSPLKSWEISISGNCKGRVDQPHISKHVKGTVNITLNLDCPNQFVSMTGILYRYPIKVPADIKFGHLSGRDKLKMNLAIPCKTNQGVSVNTYYLTGMFLATSHLPVSKTFSWPVPC